MIEEPLIQEMSARSRDMKGAAGITPATTPAEAEELARAKALIVAEGTRCCAAASREARAIVLTGSMSRGEVTLKRDGATWRVMGDATFLVVFDKPMRLGLAQLEREIEGSLFRQGVRCKVVVVTMTAPALRKMQPQIYAYELKERGIVTWGDKEALSLIPRFSAADIPKEDGWWLLCNRMIEQLESAAEAKSLRDDDPAVQYRIAKFYLAMAGCYLLTAGQYRPSYRERAARLEELAAQGFEAPIPLGRFSRFVARCTELKLQGEIATLENFPRWREAVSDAEVVWRWALGRAFGLNENLSRKELLAAVAARQPILARAKSWARTAYVYRTGIARNWPRWARLAWSTSPRYLVYGAASELFFAAPERNEIPDRELAAIARRLPLSAESGQSISWNSVAKLVARNFHLFLSSTRS